MRIKIIKIEIFREKVQFYHFFPKMNFISFYLRGKSFGVSQQFEIQGSTHHTNTYSTCATATGTATPPPHPRDTETSVPRLQTAFHLLDLCPTSTPYQITVARQQHASNPAPNEVTGLQPLPSDPKNCGVPCTKSKQNNKTNHCRYFAKYLCRLPKTFHLFDLCRQPIPRCRNIAQLVVCGQRRNVGRGNNVWSNTNF